MNQSINARVMKHVTITLLLMLTAHWSCAQHLGKHNQYFKVDLTKEASELKGKKEIRTLSHADFRLSLLADTILLFIKNRKALTHLLQEKKITLTLSLTNGQSISLNEKHIKEQMKRNIRTQAMLQSHKTIAEASSAVEKKFMRDFPNLYTDSSWKAFLATAEDHTFTKQLTAYLAAQAKTASAKDSASLMGKSELYLVAFDKTTAGALKQLDQMKQHPLKYFAGEGKTYKNEWPLSFKPTTMIGSPTEATVFFKRKNSRLFTVTFDTLYADIPDEMPIADSVWCGGDFIQDEINELEKSKNVTPCKKVTGFDCYGSFTPAFLEKKEFKVSFEKNEVKDLKGAIQPAYDYLKSENLSLKKITIKAFASVEGDSAANMALAKSRAQVMIDALQSREKDSIDATIECTENWTAFFKDLPATPFAKWKNKDTAEIRSLVNDTIHSKQLEPWLSKHRYAYMELYSAHKLSTEEKLAIVKKQYALMLDYMKTAAVEKRFYFEAKIAGLRNWLIKQYALGNFSKEQLDPFFAEMTPKLLIVNFYQQFKTVQNNKPLLGNISLEHYFLNGFYGSILNIEMLSQELKDEPKKEKIIETTIQENFVFQRQCVLSMMSAIQKKKVDAHILDSLVLPEDPAYMPIQVLVDYGRAGAGITVNGKKSNKETQINFYEQQLNTRTLVREFALEHCSPGSIYCADSRYYPLLKSYILKPGKIPAAQKSLYQKIVFLFLEIQVTETNEWSGTLYDKDFSMSKVDDLLASNPIKSLCQVQKDKMMLELSRKAAVIARTDEKTSTKKKYLNNICTYYIAHKKFVNAVQVERIVRMLLAFDDTDQYESEYLEMAYEFMRKIGVGNDRRYASLENFMKRFEPIVNVRVEKSVVEAVTEEYMAH